MAKKAYIGVSNGIKPTSTSGYINTGHILDPDKVTVIEIKCKFDNVSIYTTVAGSHYNTNWSFGINAEGKFWWVWWGYSSTTTTVAAANTWCTIRFEFTNGSQKMYINGAQVRSTTYSGKTKGSKADYLFCRNDSVITASTNVWIQSCKIWENSVIVKDFQPYVGHNSVSQPSHAGSGFYEQVEKKYYDISGGFSSENSTARIIKKIYIGINNVARLVKKVYVGVSNKARLVFTFPGAVSQKTDITALTTAVREHGAASNSNYAIFAGGLTSNGVIATVNAYNKNLVKLSADDLQKAVYALGSASIGDYALFAGGSNTSSKMAYVTAYNSSLVKTNATGLSNTRYKLVGTSVGDYAIFAGGQKSSATTYVDAYNTNLVHSNPTSLSSSAIGLNPMGTRVQNYALIGGSGENTSNLSAAVNSYSTTLVRGTATSLSVARGGGSAGYIKASNSCIFAGGYKSNNGSWAPSDNVDIYNGSLTRSTGTSLSVARGHIHPMAPSLYGYGIIICGGYSTNQYYSNVDMFDSTLSRISLTSLPEGRYSSAATSIGDYALISGGYSSSGYKNDVIGYY